MNGKNGIDLAIEKMVNLVDGLLGELNSGDVDQFVVSETDMIRVTRGNCETVIRDLDMTDPELANQVRNLKLLLGRLLTVTQSGGKHTPSRVLDMYEPAVKAIRNDLRARLNRSQDE